MLRLWSPYTATNIQKLESVQRRAARWATRDNRHTSSVTTMPQNLNWRTLDQRRIDSRLIMIYKVKYDLVAFDLVAIPASDYLTPYLRQSRHIHPLVQTYRSPLSKTIRNTPHRTVIHWNVPASANQHNTISYPDAVQQCCVPGGPYLTFNYSICFYLFTIHLTILTL